MVHIYSETDYEEAVSETVLARFSNASFEPLFWLDDAPANQIGAILKTWLNNLGESVTDFEA